VAYSFVGSFGKDEEKGSMHWEDLDKVMTIIHFFKESGLPNTQIRRIARASKSDPKEAEIWIKYLMGRKIIPWDEFGPDVGCLQPIQLVQRCEEK